MFALRRGTTLRILVCGFFWAACSPATMTLFLSMGGGLLCWLAMLLLRRGSQKSSSWPPECRGRVPQHRQSWVAHRPLPRTPASSPICRPAGQRQSHRALHRPVRPSFSLAAWTSLDNNKTRRPEPRVFPRALSFRPIPRGRRSGSTPQKRVSPAPRQRSGI